MSRGHLPVCHSRQDRFVAIRFSPAVSRRAHHVLVITLARGFGISSDGQDPTL